MLIEIISAVFAIVSSVLGFFLKNAFDKQKALEEKVDQLEKENADNKSMIALNGQRDKLLEQFYDKTVGIELKNMEKILTKLEAKFDKYFDLIIKP